MKLAPQNLKLFIFIIGALGVFGSLYFSEILKLPPCSLCWYQRIFLYPIALISLIDILRSQYSDFTHELSLSIIGLAISIYHNLVYYGFIENIVPCTQGVSCSTRQIDWLGFISIPLLSMFSFFGMSFLIILFIFTSRKKEITP